MDKITIIPNYSNFLNKGIGFADYENVVDSINLLRPLYSDYFKNINAHVSVTDFNSLKDTMLIYFGNAQSAPIDGHVVHTLLFEHIPQELTSGNVFFDKKCAVIENESSVDKCILIQMRCASGTIMDIGWYFPEKNVLLTSDWSHDNYAISLARFIKNKIIEGLNLKPLNKTKVSKIRHTPKI